MHAVYYWDLMLMILVMTLFDPLLQIEESNLIVRNYFVTKCRFTSGFLVH